MRRVMRTFAAAFLLATGFAGIADADLFVNTSATNIFYGTAELYSAGGQLLSTTTAMTVETDAAPPDNATLQDQLLYLPLMGQSVAQQIQTNPTAGCLPLCQNDFIIPNRFKDNLQTFVDTNGLGISNPDARSLDFPNTLASQQLYSILTNQPGPFVITSDTGDVLFGETQYFWGPVAVPTEPNNTAEGVDDVAFVDRDIHIQQVAAVPEPNLLGAFGLCAGLVLYRWRRRTLARQSRTATLE
jgi:hypothetical protein